MLNDFKDHADATHDYNDDDDFDTKRIEYSSLIFQSAELSGYLLRKIDMQHQSSYALAFWKSNTNELPHLLTLATL